MAKPGRRQRIGSHTSASTSAITTAPAGIHSLKTMPVPSAWNSTGEPPPGVRMISSATPPHTNDMASVTTMSGTPVITHRPPLIVPSSTPTNISPTAISSDVAKLWSSISDAASTLMIATITPSERSMPPEMTITPCAIAANASGRPPMTIVLRSNDVKVTGASAQM